MSRVLLCSALLVSLATGAALAADDAKKPQAAEPPAVKPDGGYWWMEVTKKESEPPAPAVPPKRLVYDLRNVAAADVANAVNEFLKAEASSERGRPKIVIVPEPVTNRLLVSGPPEELEQIGEMIKRIDAEPAMVQVDVLIAEIGFGDEAPQDVAGLSAKFAGKDLDAVLAELKKLGKLRTLARPSITALNNQPAFVQIGERKPRITATQSTPRGRSNAVTLENVGLILGITPRVNVDGIVTMEIDCQLSYLGPTEEGTPIAESTDGETVRSPVIQTSQAQTTISADSGQTVMLGGLISQSDASKEAAKGFLMFARPRVFHATKE